jgi:hypothetical protein
MCSSPGVDIYSLDDDGQSQLAGKILDKYSVLISFTATKTMMDMSSH